MCVGHRTGKVCNASVDCVVTPLVGIRKPLEIVGKV